MEIGSPWEEPLVAFSASKSELRKRFPHAAWKIFDWRKRGSLPAADGEKRDIAEYTVSIILRLPIALRRIRLEKR